MRLSKSIASALVDVQSLVAQYTFTAFTVSSTTDQDVTFINIIAYIQKKDQRYNLEYRKTITVDIMRDSLSVVKDVLCAKNDIIKMFNITIKEDVRSRKLVYTENDFKRHNAKLLANVRSGLQVGNGRSLNNRFLYKKMFGATYTQAEKACEEIGLGPQSMKTEYNKMIEFIENEKKK